MAATLAVVPRLCRDFSSRATRCREEVMKSAAHRVRGVGEQRVVGRVADHLGADETGRPQQGEMVDQRRPGHVERGRPGRSPSAAPPATRRAAAGGCRRRAPATSAAAGRGTSARLMLEASTRSGRSRRRRRRSRQGRRSGRERAPSYATRSPVHRPARHLPNGSRRRPPWRRAACAARRPRGPVPKAAASPPTRAQPCRATGPAGRASCSERAHWCCPATSG